MLWPIKQKYGKKISWADLMISLQTLHLNQWDFQPLGSPVVVRTHGNRRRYPLGSESEWLGDTRYSGERQLENPLAAVQMGLIYVNPEGPNGKPDPLAAAIDIEKLLSYGNE